MVSYIYADNSASVCNPSVKTTHGTNPKGPLINNNLDINSNHGSVTIPTAINSSNNNMYSSSSNNNNAFMPFPSFAGEGQYSWSYIY